MQFNQMTYVTQTALAAYLDITRETISDHVARGSIKKRADGKYDLQECIRGIVKWQSSKLSGRIGNEEMATQRVNLAREQAESVALKNAIVRGEFVRLEVYAKVHETHLMVFRERCLIIPGACADQLTSHTPADRAAIELVLRDKVYEALEELSDPGWQEKAMARVDEQKARDGRRADDVERIPA
jgi:phage terminase Nu1 subunit (DNA packaging protein)